MSSSEHRGVEEMSYPAKVACFVRGHSGEAPERTSNREFYRAATEHFHTRLSIHIPDAVLRLLMGEASQVITGGRCALPETLMREGFQFQYPDILTFFNKAFSVSS